VDVAEMLELSLSKLGGVLLANKCGTGKTMVILAFLHIYTLYMEGYLDAACGRKGTSRPKKGCNRSPYTVSPYISVRQSNTTTNIPWSLLSVIRITTPYSLATHHVSPRLFNQTRSDGIWTNRYGIAAKKNHSGMTKTDRAILKAAKNINRDKKAAGIDDILALVPWTRSLSMQRRSGAVCRRNRLNYSWNGRP
jgi:hypothetical protein